MVKRIPFILIIAITICGQFINGQPASVLPGNGFLYSEIHPVVSDSGFTLFYTYRIPYNRFVFIKEGNKYSTKFRISIEVTDSLAKHVTRQIEEENIIAGNYDETNSGKVSFEGIIKFNLPAGIYKLMPEITDLNSNQDLKLHELRVNLYRYMKKNFMPPVVIQNDEVKCKEITNFELTNFDNSIPFSEEEYGLIIPAHDTTLNSIYIAIINGEDTVYKNRVEKHFLSKIILTICEGKIIIKSSDSLTTTNNFILDNFSNLLKAGATEILVSKDSSFKNKEEFNIPVVWFDEPFSLRNPKEAIEYLADIENRNIVDSLLSFSTEEYPKVLLEFWKKYDPTRESEFNPLMNEFYLRVDYTIKNYATLSGKNGADTDRGKIYIQYGKPKEIERFSNQYGKVEEKWIYENPFRSFEFIDNEGAGNYTLIK